MLPWTEYLFGVLIAAYREFEARLGTLTVARGAETPMVYRIRRGDPCGRPAAPPTGESEGDHKGRPYGMDNPGRSCAPVY